MTFIFIAKEQQECDGKVQTVSSTETIGSTYTGSL